MNDVTERAMNALALSDEKFFEIAESLPREIQSRFVESFRHDRGEDAGPPPPGQTHPYVLVIGAPASVRLAEHGDFPLLVGEQSNGLRQWQVDPKQNTLVVVTDLGSGVVRTRLLAATHKRMAPPEPSGSGPAPEGIGARAVSRSVRFLTRASKHVGIDPHPSRLGVCVIDFDRISNILVTELKGDGEEHTAPPPMAASTFLGAIPAESGMEAPSMTLAVPESASANAPVPIRCHVMVSADRVAVLPTDHGAEHSVLMSTLLLVRLDEHALQIDMAAPAVVSTDGATVRASFEFDARDALRSDLQPGTYQVYLVAGAAVAGPQKLKVTDY